MISIFRGKRQRQRSAGIAFCPQGISLAIIERRGGEPQLCDVEHLPLDGHTSRADTLRHLARQHDLGRQALRAVLCPDDYTMLQMEAPEVSPEELKSAVRWSIKDMIDFHIDDAVIDVFELPRPARKASALLLSVVAAKRSLITDLLTQFQHAELDPNSIDITELALRNLGALCSENEHPIATLFLMQHQAWIEITVGNTLCLARRLTLDDSSTSDISELAFDTDYDDDNLGLELQRSLDHFESHFGLGPARRLSVLCSDDQPSVMNRLTRDLFNIEVQPTELQEHLRGAEEIPHELLAPCLPAIGAALRQ